MTTPPVVDVKNLRKVYQKTGPRQGPGLFEALKDISFFIEKGEIFGILGPNGAGKTTTLEIMEGLKKQTSGSVSILGMDTLTDTDRIKRVIGVQLQTSRYVPFLTLGELLSLFGSFYGKKAEIGKLLHLVDLEDKEHEQVQNLSGGQQQRFTIATSLVHDPSILFLDEPTTGLDPAARRNLWHLIKSINHSGTTIILTTHYMEEAEFLCGRVAIMDGGKILEIDEPRKLIDDLSHTTQISFLTDQDTPESLFRHIPAIGKIYNQKPKTTIEIESLDHIAPVIEALKKNNIRFSGFTVKTASLEDVYLDLTGKQYEA